MTTTQSSSANTAPTFSVGDGRFVWSLGNSNELVFSARLDTQGRILVAGSQGTAAMMSRFNANGSLDTTFGSGGILTSSLTGAFNDFAIHSDGSITAVGGGTSYVIARYGADGGFLSSKTQDISPSNSAFADVAVGVGIQTDGKIVIGGYSNTSTTNSANDFSVARFTDTALTLDNTYSLDGRNSAGLSADDVAYAMILDSSNRAIVAGYTTVSTDRQFAVARFTASGTVASNLDTSFSSDGKLAEGSTAGFEEARALALQSDGKILVAGYSQVSTTAAYDFAIMRLTTDGSVDTAFRDTLTGLSQNGRPSYTVGTGNDFAYAVAVQSDGKIILGGTAQITGSDYDFALLRLNVNGTVDTSFGTQGRVITRINSGRDEIRHLDIQSDGKIIASGYSANGSLNDITLVRYNIDGSVDTTFNPVNTLNATPTFTEGGNAVVLDSDVMIRDVELATADSYLGASVQLQRAGGASAEDVFSAASGSTVSALTEGADLTVGGVSVGTVTQNSAGILIITFSTLATQARVNTVLQSLSYSNSSENPSTPITVSWVFSDNSTVEPQQVIGQSVITVNGVNDAPTLDAVNAISFVDTSADNTFSAFNGTLAGSDVDNTALTFGVTGGIDNGATVTRQGAFGTLTVTKATGAYTYAPSDAAIEALLADSSESFTVSVSDGTATTTQSLVVNVTGAADTPALQSFTTQVITDTSGNDSFSALTGQIAVASGSNAGLSYAVAGGTVAGDESVLQSTYGTVRVNRTTGAYTFDPDSAAINALKITVNTAFQLTATNGRDVQTTALNIQLAGANDAPGFTSAPIASLVDTSADDTFTARTGSIASTDRDGDAVTLGLSGGTDNGTTITRTGTYGTLTFTKATSAYSYAPSDVAIEALSANASDVFTFTASDGTASGSTTLTISITGASDAPALSTPAAIAYTDTAADDTFSARSGTVQFTGNATAFGISGGTDGTSSVTRVGTYGTLTIVKSTGAYTFTPRDTGIEPLKANATETFTITASNPRDASLGTATLSVNISATNDAPVVTTPTAISVIDTASDDTFATRTGTLVLSDRDADTLTVGISGGTDNGSTVSRAGSFGTLTVTKATGAYSYAPNDAAIEALLSGSTDNFTFTINDGSTTVNTSLVVNVSGAADTPALQALTTRVIADTVANDSFASLTGQISVATGSSAGLTYGVVGGIVSGTESVLQSTYGTMRVNRSTGAYTFDPDSTAINALKGSVTSSFSLTASNGRDVQTTALSIRLDGADDAPVANAPAALSYTDTVADDTFAASTGTITGTDRDGDSLTVGIGGGTDNGSTVSRVGTYGTLTVTKVTGAYRYDANDAAMEALNASASESFTLTLSDGAASVNTTLTVNITGAQDPVPNTAPSFSVGDGRFVWSLGSSTEIVNAAAVDGSGRILVAGSQGNAAMLSRFNGNGSLDTSFGNNGIITSSTVSAYNDVIVSSGGTITAVGGGSAFVADTYGANGGFTVSRTLDISGGNDIAEAIVASGTGFVLAGTAFTSATSDFALTRITGAGAVDATFGSNGRVTSDISGSDSGFAAAVQADGKIVVVGSLLATGTTSTDIAVARFTATGLIDSASNSPGTSFGNSGKAQPLSFGTGSDVATSVAIQSDGKILVAGYAQIATNGVISNDFVIARYTGAGELDATFGSGGKVSIAIGAGDDVANAMVLQSDGKIVLGGSSVNASGNRDFALVRLTSAGGLDSTFAGGKVTTGIMSGTNDVINQLSIQADGKIVASGYSGTTTNDITLVRYNTDGTVDTTFNPVNTLNATPTYVEDGAAVVLDSDVQIFDSELASAGNYDGATFRLQRAGTANEQDVFSAAASSTVSALVEGQAITVGGVPIGSVTQQSGGVLVLTFDANATQERVNTVLQSLSYANTSQNPPATVTIDWLFNDNNTGAQGLGPAQSVAGQTVVNITAVNDTPTLAAPDSIGFTDTTANDTFTTVSGQLAGSDVDNNNLVYTIAGGTDIGNIVVRQGTFGTLTVTKATGAYTYAPSDSAIEALLADASESFSVTVSDGALSASQTLQVNVTAVADTPALDTPNSIIYTDNSDNNDFADVSGQLSVSGGSVSGLTYGASGSVANGNLLTVTGAYGVLTVNLTTGAYTFAPDDTAINTLKATANATFVLTATNGRDVQSTTLSLQLNGVNDAPVFASSPAVTYTDSPGDDVFQLTTGSVPRTDREGDSLTYSVSGGTDSGATITSVGTYGTLTLVKATGAYTYTPDQLAMEQLTGTATDVFTLTLDDGSLTGSDTLTITVRGVNEAPTFAIGTGQVLTPFGTSDDVANGMFLLPDGRFYLAGQSNNGSNNDIAVSRYLLDGTLDAGFSGDGKLTDANGTGQDVARAVTVQSDGKAVVVGSSTIGTSLDFSVLRYNTNGSLDTSFSGDGKATTVFSVSGVNDEAYAAAVQTDGKILVAGYTVTSGTNTTAVDFAIARYNTDGTLDSTGFNASATTASNRGKVSFDFLNSADTVYALAVQADGKILVGGQSVSGTNSDFALARLTAAGALDTTFSGDGKQTTAVGSGEDVARAMHLLSDGKVLLAGWSNNGINNDFALVRYTADGNLDNTFNGTGRVVTTVGTGRDQAYAMTLQADGKILLAGSAVNNGNDDFAVVRYNANGTLDTSFGTGGRVITAVSSGADVAHSIVVEADGKILVSGSVTVGGHLEFASVRYNADGSVDTTFGPVDTLGDAVAYTEQAPAVLLDSTARIYDPEAAAAGDFSASTLVLRRQGGAQAEDVFTTVAGGALGALVEGGDLTLSDTVIGTVTGNSGGTLSLSFNAQATAARVNAVMQQIAYSNTSDNPAAAVTIAWTFSDGNRGGDTSLAQTVSGTTVVNITAVNDLPVLQSVQAISYTDTAADNTFANTTGQLQASDVDNPALSYGVTGGSDNGTTVSRTGSYGVLTVNKASGSYTYAPNDAAIEGLTSNAAETFTLTVSDGTATVNTTLQVNLTGANDTLVLSAPSALTFTDTSTDDTFTTRQGTLSASDRDNNTLAFGLANGTDNGSTVSRTGTYGTLIITKATGAYTFTPNDSAIEALTANASEQFNVTVSDGTSNANTTLQINLTGAGDAATLSAPTAISFTDTSADNTFGAVGATIQATGSASNFGIANGSDNGTTVSRTGTYGTLTITKATGAYTYTPNDAAVEALKQNATESFTITAGNPRDASTSSTTLAISLTGANDAPVLSTPTALSFTETSADDTFTTRQGTLSASDRDNDTLTYGLANGTDNGTTVSRTGTYGTLTVTKATGAYTFTPNDSAIEALTANASEQFTMTVSDGTASVSTALQINLTGVNDLPASADVSLSAASSEQLVLTSLLFAFTDRDASQLLNGIRIASLPASGQLRRGADVLTAGALVSKSDLDAGNLKFQAPQATSSAQTLTFQFKVLDASGAESTAAQTVTIQMEASTANNPPSGTLSIQGVARVGQTLSAVSTVSDADGLGSFSYSWFSNNVVISGANQSTFTLTSAQAGRQVSVRASYTDGRGNGEQITSASTVLVGAVLAGGVGNDSLLGLSGDDSITGGAGNDTLNGAAGQDTMLGGDGSDIYYVDNIGDVVTETNTSLTTGGTDLVITSLSSYTLGANIENGRINITSAANMTGNSLGNIIYAGAGNNVLDGGSGTDWASYRFGLASGATRGVTVSLATNAAQVTQNSGSDTLLNFENLEGSALNDTLTGNAAANELNGREGADTLIGGDGSDTYYVDNAGDVLTETNAVLTTGGTDLVVSTLSSYTLGANIENGRANTTSAANLTGNSLNNILYAGVGNNVLDGSGGADTVSYVAGLAIGSTVGVTVSLAVTGAQSTGSSGSDTLLNIEGLEGSSLADSLTGDSGANTLNGGAGADTLIGGDGSDAYYVDNLGDVVAESNASSSTGGTDLVYTSLASYTLTANVERGRIIASGASNLTGNTLDNFIFAGTGNNILDGAGGSDTVFYSFGLSSRATTGVTVSLALTTAQNTGSSGTDTILNIENLTGSSLADRLTGNSGANILNGSGGVDTLTGGEGADTFVFDSTTVGTQVDIVTDMTSTDRIDVRGIDAVTATSGDQAFTFMGTSAFASGQAGRLRYEATQYQGSAALLVQGDMNGDAVADFSIIVVGQAQLISSQFLL